MRQIRIQFSGKLHRIHVLVIDVLLESRGEESDIKGRVMTDDDVVFQNARTSPFTSSIGGLSATISLVMPVRLVMNPSIPYFGLISCSYLSVTSPLRTFRIPISITSS